MPLDYCHPTAPHKKLKLPEWYVSSLMMDRALDAICRRVKTLDRKHDIPYLAGYSLDGKTIYIDRHLPRKMKSRGREIEVEVAQAEDVAEQEMHQVDRRADPADQHHPDARASQLQQNPLRATPGPDAHAIPGLQSQPGQPPRRFFHFFVQLTICPKNRIRPRDQREPIREFPRHRRERLIDRLATQRQLRSFTVANHPEPQGNVRPGANFCRIVLLNFLRNNAPAMKRLGFLASKCG